MKLRQGLSQVSALDISEARQSACKNGYLVFVLPASIIDRASFFDAIRANFPLDPPLVGSRSWDALSDSLWEGLHSISDERIAILWPHATAMAKKNPADFAIALNVLEDVAAMLADSEVTNGQKKIIAVVVAVDPRI